LEKLSNDLRIGKCVRFLGERHDIAAILASLDIVVSPSRSESLSNTILEAMAAGRPVIATRVGGNPEIVRDRETGFLVPAGDENALANALETMLASPDLARRLGENSRSVANTKFSLDRARDRFEQLYRNLLVQKSERRGADVTDGRLD
jgi:glycosyltransferase involved in cell wall biosynthesis